MEQMSHEKIPMIGVGKLLKICCTWMPQSAPPVALHIPLGCLLKLFIKTLFQKKTYILIAKYNKIKLEMNWKPYSWFLAFIMPENAIQGPGEEKSSTLLPSCEPYEQFQKHWPNSQDVPTATIVAWLLGSN